MKKQRWLAARDRVEARLPLIGVLVVMETSGMACDLPIFQVEDGQFAYDSYGTVPPNYKDFDRNIGYGMCGSHGTTKRIAVIAKSIRLLNRKQRVGLCTKSVIDKLRQSGRKISVVKSGFR